MIVFASACADAVFAFALASFGVRLRDSAVLPVLWLAATTPWLVRTDLRERRLPNAATLGGLALVVTCLIVAAFRGAMVPDRDALAGLTATMGVLVVGLFASRGAGFGGGDAKLAALTTGSLCLVDPGLLGPFAAATAVVGCGAAGVVICRGRVRSARPSSRPAAAVSAGRGTPRRPQTAEACPPPVTLPFGPVLLAGYWFALALHHVSLRPG